MFNVVYTEQKDRLLQSYDYHVIFLFLAFLIYGLFGSPTPNQVGFFEFIIGLLLVLGTGLLRVRDVLFGVFSRKFWKSAGLLLLIYGLTVPVIIAVSSGYSLSSVFRDILPFLFLFMPLFALPVIRARPNYFRVIVFVAVLIGLLFSLRSLLMRYHFACDLWCGDELLYLENMPTVLFSALFLIGCALQYMAHGLTLKNLVIFLCLICFALLPVAAMAVTAQRASLAAVFLYSLIIQGMIVYRSPLRGMNAVILGMMALAIINLSFLHLFQVLWQKTADVGFNMRPQEMRAVWDIVTIDLFTFFFGIGWGGSFDNPAVGGVRVNFTHNFFSSFFLKTGIVGVILASFYIGGLLERLIRVILRNPILGFALCAPILIDLTFYASFKSLDFGLMLLMISGSLVYMRQCEDHRF